MFSDLMNVEKCKDLYRKLAFRLHPDHGGSNELMIMLQAAYDRQIKYLIDIEKIYEDSIESSTYENVYEKIFRYDERLNIFKEIEEYAENHKNYDTKFFNSVKEFLSLKGYVTPNQYNALVKIYYAFEMNLK